MKPTIENQEDLLKHLALQGDPQAFFLLTAPYFRARYQKERNDGVAFQDAQTRIIAEAMDLIEGLQHVNPARFDAWFEEHCGMLAGEPPENKPETLFDKRRVAETEVFLNTCGKELLRTASSIKNECRRRKRRFPYLLFPNKIVVGLLIFVGIVGLLFAGTTIMAAFRMAIIIGIDTKGNQFLWRFPPTMRANKETFRISSGNLDPAGALLDKDTSAITPAVVPSSRDIMRQSNTAHAGVSLPKKQGMAARPAQEKKTLPPIVPRARMTPAPLPPQVTEPVQPPVPDAETSVSNSLQVGSTTPSPPQNVPADSLISN